MESVEECQLCCRVVDNATTLKPTTSLSNYLYHKTVRETLLPSPDVLEGDAATRVGEEMSKLTFTFSLGGTQPPSNREMLLCDVCLNEINQLESLHQQLESCKKLITAQVERIETVCGTEDTGVQGNRKREPLWRKGSVGFGSKVALAGTTVGNNNISLVLRCLGSLCDGISTHYHSSSQKGSEGDVSEVLSSIPKMEQDQGDEMNVYETDATGPLVELSVGSNTPRNSSISQESVIIVDNLCEVSLSPIKFEPVSSLNPRNDATSSLGEMDPLEFYSEDINTDPLEEDDDCTPTDNSAQSMLTTDEHLSTFPTVSDPPPCNIIVVSKHKEAYSVLGSLPTKRTKAKAKTCKKVACQICSKRMTRGALRSHMKRHTGLAPFKCEVCGKGFIGSANLEDHRRVHTGDKPFTCNLCDYSFTQRCTLNRHLRNVHGENTTKKGAEDIK